MTQDGTSTNANVGSELSGVVSFDATGRGNANGLAEVRLGMLTGDRRCHACGFNLRGQMIVREEHYGMVMVRCPECGVPAPLMDYPRLGHWGRRFGMLTMIVFLGVLIAAHIAFGGMVAIWSTQAAMESTREPAIEVARAYIEHAKAAAIGPQVNQNLTWAAQQEPSWHTWIDGVWWSQNREKFSPVVRSFSRESQLFWLFGSLILLPGGAVLACLMPHARGVRRVMIPGVVGAIGLGIVSIVVLVDRSQGSGRNAVDCVLELVGIRAYVPHVLVLCVPVLVGVYLGRPMARGLVRWLVPPRQYVHFGWLWSADGLGMPRMKSKG